MADSQACWVLEPSHWRLAWWVVQVSGFGFGLEELRRCFPIIAFYFPLDPENKASKTLPCDHLSQSVAGWSFFKDSFAWRTPNRSQTRQTRHRWGFLESLWTFFVSFCPFLSRAPGFSVGQMLRKCCWQPFKIKSSDNLVSPMSTPESSERCWWKLNRAVENDWQGVLLVFAVFAWGSMGWTNCHNTRCCGREPGDSQRGDTSFHTQTHSCSQSTMYLLCRAASCRMHNISCHKHDMIYWYIYYIYILIHIYFVIIIS